MFVVVSAGGGPSTTAVTGRRNSPPHTSCHATSVTMSTGGVQRLIITKPRPETTTEPSPAATPTAVTAEPPRRTNNATPAMPTSPAVTLLAVARSPMIAHARPITTNGDPACRVDATPPGSS